MSGESEFTVVIYTEHLHIHGNIIDAMFLYQAEMESILIVQLKLTLKWQEDIWKTMPGAGNPYLIQMAMVRNN